MSRRPLPLLLTLAAAACAAAGPAATGAAAPEPAHAPVAAPTAPPPAPKPALPEKETSVEGITEYRLANGLRVLLFPDPTKQTVTVNITYLVGSRNEDYGETGMAHLLEHLVFKGTPKHPNIPQELTSHGARPNGTTSDDRTNYFETFSSTDENLDWALDLESDRMVNSYIARKDLDSEMTVVRNEFERGENDPLQVLEQRVGSTAYLWHNYGKSTIGARSDIENVPIERLQGFYHRYYQPDNAVLLVAGKIDEAKTLEKIAARFGPLPRPERKLQTTYTVEPTQDGERSVTLRRVGDVQGLVAAYHGPAAAHPDNAALEVLAQVLGDVPSGRLHKDLVETKKASSTSADFRGEKEPGLLVASAEVRTENKLEDSKAAFLAILDAAAGAKAIAPEEVERAKARLLKNLALTLNSADRVGLLLSNWIGAGDWRLFFLNRDLVRKVTVEDVRRVAALYLKPSNRTLGEFIPTAKPDRTEVPAAPDLEKLLAGYTGDKAKDQGEAFDPAPANIEARTRRSKLDGGLQLALLPKKTRGGSVVASLTLHVGDVQSLKGLRTVGDLSVDMLMRGSKSKTRQQITDALDQLQTRMNVGGAPGTVGATLETTRENLAAALRLLAEVLQTPAFPEKEFELLRQENLAQVERSRAEPQEKATRALGRHLGKYEKGDPRETPTLDELAAEYQKAKLAEVAKFHADFLGAQSAELAVVGDFDDAEIAKLAKELFGQWKAKKPFTRIPKPYQQAAPLSEAIEAPDKANAFFIAAQPMQMKDQDPDYPAMVLGNYMLGGGFLNSRLAVRIRQKEGLSYGVGANFNAPALDDSAAFFGFAIYAPQNVEKLERAFREEIARAVDSGFTDQEVAEAQKGWLQSRGVSRAQDAALARQLGSYLFLGRTLAWDEAKEKEVAALTPAQVRRRSSGTSTRRSWWSSSRATSPA